MRRSEILTLVVHIGPMTEDVNAKVDELAARGEATVNAALARYEEVRRPFATRDGQAWVSVAFMLARRGARASKLPE